MRRLVSALLLFLPLTALAGAEKFGAPPSGAPKVALQDLVANPDAWAGKIVRTEGPVSAVCSQKGCWMTLKSGEKFVRVTFKDYGFFVPKDGAGCVATVEGVFKVATLPEETSSAA